MCVRVLLLSISNVLFVQSDKFKQAQEQYETVGSSTCTGCRPKHVDGCFFLKMHISAAEFLQLCRDKFLLNGAVRAYLTSQGYKLTALTFSEEGGSNIPATLPPTGSTLFQMFQGNNQKLAATEATEVTCFRSLHELRHLHKCGSICLLARCTCASISHLFQSACAS